jgi:hypothetical protein
MAHVSTFEDSLPSLPGEYEVHLALQGLAAMMKLQAALVASANHTAAEELEEPIAMHAEIVRELLRLRFGSLH